MIYDIYMAEKKVSFAVFVLSILGFFFFCIVYAQFMFMNEF